MPGPFRHRPDLAALNARNKANAVGNLGIEFTEQREDFLRGTVPVDHRTLQPYGLLHGGASVLLAETLGSSAGMLCVGDEEACVGIEINEIGRASCRERVWTVV